MFYKVRKKLSTVFVLFVIHHDNDLFWSEELILLFFFFRTSRNKILKIIHLKNLIAKKIKTIKEKDSRFSTDIVFKGVKLCF